MRITAGRLKEGPTPEETTSGLVAQTGFTITTFSGYQSGPLATVYAEIVTTNAISQSSGNLSPDVAIATLPDGWKPRNPMNGIYGNGVMDGEFVISTSGVIQLRSALANISAGTTIRLQFAYFYATT